MNINSDKINEEEKLKEGFWWGRKLLCVILGRGYWDSRIGRGKYICLGKFFKIDWYVICK